MHKGARAVCISAYLPEMEVHARGENRKEHDLETIHMGVSLVIVGKNTQQGVEVHTHKTGFGRRIGARNRDINGSIIKVFMRFTHLKEQRCEYIQQ
jgi:hypothetical protein